MYNRYSVPGIYIAPEPERIAPITLSGKYKAGFVGIAEKGPLNCAVTLSSFSQFQSMFGNFTDYSYLAYSVYGFFKSGGKECVVVRIAHIDKYDDKNSASKAAIDVMDTDFNESFKIRTLTEGTWGNFVKIKLWYIVTDSILTISKSDNEDWQEWFVVDSIENFDVNNPVGIRCGSKVEYRTIKKIDLEKKRIHLNAKLKEQFNPEDESVFIENVRFNLNVIKGNSVEEFLFLSTNIHDDKYFLKEINGKSRFIEVEGKSNALPLEIYYQTLQNGRNGVLGLTPADFIGHYNEPGDHSGLGAFEAFEEISVLAIPDLILFQEVVHKEQDKALNDIFAVQKAMIDQAEKLRDRFAVLDMPDLKEFMDILRYRDKFDSAYGAIYYPLIEVTNPMDYVNMSTVKIPPSGHIAGVYMACDVDEGIHRAPANKFLGGAVGIERNIEDDEYEVTYPRGINCLRFVPGKGIKIWGARTLSSDIEWRYVNVRRTFSAIRDAIKNGSGWAVFEPNNSSLRKRIVRHVTAFLLDLWRKGYLGGVVPEEGFFIRCDDELNPVEEVDAGRINVEVGIAIAKPAEFLVMTFKTDKDESKITFD